MTEPDHYQRQHLKSSDMYKCTKYQLSCHFVIATAADIGFSCSLELQLSKAMIWD